METKTENIVLVAVEDYLDLRAKADRTDEYLDRLAHQESIKIAKQNIGKINVRIYLAGKSYDDDFIDLKIYDELSPQLEHLVQKLKYWTQEALQEEYGTWHYMKKATKEVEESEKLKDRYGRIAAWGWLTSFTAIVLLIAHVIFR
jgi:hypothetical protein